MAGNRQWTEMDDLQLHDYVVNGLRDETIAVLLDRTVSAVDGLDEGEAE